MRNAQNSTENTAESRRGSGSLLAWAQVALLIATVLVVFGRVLRHEFLLWDDNLNVYENPLLMPLHGRSLAQIWTRPYLSMYIPIPYTVWAALVYAVRPGPGALLPAAPFHLLNLLCHACGTLVVFAICSHLVGRDHAAYRWAPVLGALLFAVHPLHVEAVAWITGLKDVLSGLFILTACWQLLRYVRLRLSARTGSERAGAPGRALLFGSLAFLAALLTKPAAVVTPAIAGLLAWTAIREHIDSAAGKRIARGLLATCLMWGALAGAWTVLTMVLQPAASSGVHVPVAHRPLIATDALLFYLRKLIVPFPLGPDYGRTPALVIARRSPLVFLLPAAAAFALWRRRRQCADTIPMPALFVIALLPVLGFVPFAFQYYSTVADRYAYVALLAPAVLLARALRTTRSTMVQTAATGTAMLCIAAAAALAHRQAGHWRNNDTLFSHALAVNPQSWVAHNNLGLVRARQGNPEQAVRHYHNAIAANAAYEPAYNNLGLALADLGKQDEAQAAYRSALHYAPGYAEAHNNLAILLAARGRTDEALAHYSAAVRINPCYVDALNNLAIVLAARGETEHAVHCYSQALRIRPDLVPAHINLANVLGAHDKTLEAVQHYSRALQLDPQSVEAHFNLGNLYGRGKRYHEAAHHFSAALQRQPNLHEAARNLKAALDAIDRAKPETNPNDTRTAPSVSRES